MFSFIKNLLPVTDSSGDERPMDVKIDERLIWDRRISKNDIRITVENEVANLTGVVDSFEKMEAAEELVWGLRGVINVVNKIRVDPFMKRTDEHLTHLIRRAISLRAIWPNERINVHVKDGIVELTGIVQTKEMKAFASGAAWKVSGVRDCVNAIEIAKQPPQLPIDPLLLKINYSG